MSVPINPDSAGHDRFEEFCALAAIGELSADEVAEFRIHLSECTACRELSADFLELASDDLTRAALEHAATDAAEEAAGVPDEQAVLARILARAEDASAPVVRRFSEDPVGRDATVAPGMPARRAYGLGLSPWRKMAYAAAACLLCVVVALGGYELRDRELSGILAARSSEVNTWKARSDAHEEAQRQLAQSVKHAQVKVQALEESVSRAQAESADAKTKLADSEAHRKALADELSARQVELERANTQLGAAKSDAQQKDAALAELKARVQSAAARTAHQEQIADDLRRRLESAQTASRQPSIPDVGDAEAKELLGARDLHIVDVYDVNANGQTRRTYGRVYYVEKKLLVFYAFDLQDKPRKRAPVGFQAWGYQEAGDRRPQSLGLFHLDDSSLNRWVLKVRNPGVLAHVDAVFVSLEPAGGSSTPDGPRVLYANLASPPNHP